MAIKIVTENESLQIKAIITYLFADPGLGKTSLGFTANKAIVLDFDGGAHRTGALRRGAVVQAKNWSDVSELSESDLASFETVVIDTVGRMLDSIKAYLSTIPANRQKDGALKLKAQGMANDIFKTFVNKLISFGKDVVFIAHAAEDKNDDKIIVRPDLGGKNRNELYRAADIMGYLSNVTTQEGKTERLLNFKPSTTHHTKNSGDLGEVYLPDLMTAPNFLGELIQRAKDHINTMTPAQLERIKATEELENWKSDCEAAQFSSEINTLIQSLDKNHMFYREMRHSIVKRAEDLKLMMDKEKGRYFEPDFIGISDEQRDHIQALLAESGIDVREFCEEQGIESLLGIAASNYKTVVAHINSQKKGAA